MARQLKSMDGNNAAAWVSYAFTEVAAFYHPVDSWPTLLTSGRRRA